jgi:hypothetical protein
VEAEIFDFSRIADHIEGIVDGHLAQLSTFQFARW